MATQPALTRGQHAQRVAGSPLCPVRIARAFRRHPCRGLPGFRTRDEASMTVADQVRRDAGFLRPAVRRATTRLPLPSGSRYRMTRADGDRPRTPAAASRARPRRITRPARTADPAPPCSTVRPVCRSFRRTPGKAPYGTLRRLIARHAGARACSPSADRTGAGSWMPHPCQDLKTFDRINACEFSPPSLRRGYAGTGENRAWRRPGKTGTVARPAASSRHGRVMRQP
jgi:hypothetical protein